MFRKPFYKLEKKEEIQRYFRKTKPWKKLPEVIANEITNRMIDNREAFNIFVQISMDCKLVENNYIPLCGGSNTKDVGNTELIIMLFAQTLYNSGGLFRDRLLELNEIDLNNSRIHNWLEAGKMLYESSIGLEPYYIPPYYQLAFLWGQIQKDIQMGIQYCQEAIDKIDEIESTDDNLLTYTQKQYKKAWDLSIMKEKLVELLAEYS